MIYKQHTWGKSTFPRPLYTRLWRMFTSEVKVKANRRMEAIGRHKCGISCRPGEFPMHVNEGTPKKGNSQDTSNEKLTETSEGITKIVGEERAGSSREVDLDIDFQGLKTKSELVRNVL